MCLVPRADGLPPLSSAWPWGTVLMQSQAPERWGTVEAILGPLVRAEEREPGQPRICPQSLRSHSRPRPRLPTCHRDPQP